jgi:hypothetical protein
LQDHVQSRLVVEEYKSSATRAMLTTVVARSSTAQTAEGEQPYRRCHRVQADRALGYARRLDCYGRTVPLTTTSIVGRDVMHG